ncbi:hypothetical protein HPP92_014338 [Vanilla planifolia]|uniref:Uncharacterized protein n=1 Tax=Vanilla planifolia TaxID=51239 RepID=A0A835UUN6_VANPL|nr:hypothetical protein HPP92_014338 [Vanilla planifolia]
METVLMVTYLQGHSKEIHGICWDTKGEYLASVSQDCVKVWSLTSGECVNEHSSNGNKFHSCVFHPSYPNLLIIGGYQSLELWNMVEKQTVTVQAHEGLIPALAQSFTGMVASASHDTSVKYIYLYTKNLFLLKLFRPLDDMIDSPSTGSSTSLTSSFREEEAFGCLGFRQIEPLWPLVAGFGRVIAAGGEKKGLRGETEKRFRRGDFGMQLVSAEGSN